MLHSLRPTHAEVQHAVKHVVLLQRLSGPNVSPGQLERFERLRTLAAVLDETSPPADGPRATTLHDDALGERLRAVERRIAEKQQKLQSLRNVVATRAANATDANGRVGDDGADGEGWRDDTHRGIAMMSIPDNEVMFGVSGVAAPHPPPADEGTVEVSPCTDTASSSSSTTGSNHDDAAHSLLPVMPAPPSLLAAMDDPMDGDGSEASAGIDVSFGGAPSQGTSDTGGSTPSMHRQRAAALPMSPLSTSPSLPVSPGAAISSTTPPQHKVWVPPPIALAADQPQDDGGDSSTPRKHRLVLYTRTVMRKPQGFQAKDTAMKEQGQYCKGCLVPLKTTFSAARLGRSWDNAKFCYYTGYYYCKRCHPCTETSPIPARIVNYWDFTPLSVCSDAKNFLELYHDAPTLCLSAVNPKLYELLSVLRAARSLRIQLNLLVDVGLSCPQFRAEFFGEVVSTEASPNTVDEMLRMSDRQRAARRSSGGMGPSLTVAPREEDAHVIPTARRYLVEDSEFWSIADLMDIKTVEDAVQQLDVVEMQRIKEALAVDANGKLNTSASTFRSASSPKLSASQTSGGFLSPTARGAGGPPSESRSSLVECDLTKFLKQTRSNMVRHVVQLCRHGPNCCLRRAAQMCPLCKKKDFVYIFDINRTRTCTRCGSCYHRDCWHRRRGHHTACVVCVNKMVSCASPSNATSPREEGRQGVQDAPN